jgi:tetratricopeptide (TPR) repeat protein
MQRLFLGVAVVFLSCLVTAANLNADDAADFVNRGNEWKRKGEYDKAIADYTEAIRLNPKYADAFNKRGIAWARKSEYDKAIADYNQALSINPKDAEVYNNRGNVWIKDGEYEKAIRDYNRALTINPRVATTCNALAWLYATCRDARFRDGKKAFEIASKAYQLTKGKNCNCIDTLAAAYAECGDFKAATEWESKAIALAQNEKSKQELRSRLELYKQGKPYREELKKK